jgi:N6-adenosine-specific RNA methylase IME4
MTYDGFPRNGRYRTILADPPWHYEQALKGQRGELPYETMTDDEILSLPVEQAAAPDCLLLLWTTNSHLPLALRCVERWGFTYQVLATWGKITKDRRPHIGLGYRLRGATEHLIWAECGKPWKGRAAHGAAGHAWSTLMLAERREHSLKPDEAYAMAEDVGEPPRLELFARAHRSGWDTWGNVTLKSRQDTLTGFADAIPLGPGPTETNGRA